MQPMAFNWYVTYVRYAVEVEKQRCRLNQHLAYGDVEYPRVKSCGVASQSSPTTFERLRDPCYVLGPPWAN